MAQTQTEIVTHKQSSTTDLKPKRLLETKISDFDSYLHWLWLQKMALSPDLYDDAKVSHTHGKCVCGCTSSHSILETPQKKEKKK